MEGKFAISSATKKTMLVWLFAVWDYCSTPLFALVFIFVLFTDLEVRAYSLLIWSLHCSSCRDWSGEIGRLSGKQTAIVAEKLLARLSTTAILVSLAVMVFCSYTKH